MKKREKDLGLALAVASLLYGGVVAAAAYWQRREEAKGPASGTTEATPAQKVEEGPELPL